MLEIQPTPGRRLDVRLGNGGGLHSWSNLVRLLWQGPMTGCVKLVLEPRLMVNWDSIKPCRVDSF